MPDHHLDPIFSAIDYVIGEDHQRELRAYFAGHDAEAREWVLEIAHLAHLRTLLERMPYAATIEQQL